MLTSPLSTKAGLKKMKDTQKKPSKQKRKHLRPIKVKILYVGKGGEKLSRTRAMIMLCIAYGAKIKFVIAGLPLNVLSIMNYLFLLQYIFNWVMVLLDVADLLLAIPSSRNKLCPLQNAFNWPRIIFVLVPF